MQPLTEQPYTYRLLASSRTDEDGTIVPIYGIEVYSKNAHTPLRSLPDLFTRFSQANELVELCNRLQLDPVHLTAVIEDALCPV